ncbi:MAG TPA: alkaline phosphatase family protein, partial [Opitutaceae bacterium]|nr:alkaline phosphatase family protein [Opitutaceae bacterium]
YRKDEIPERLHYRNNPRIPDILLIADEGWQIERKTPDAGYYAAKRRGSHGFDNALESMRGIFIAAGPSFPKARTLPAFENIHIYNLLCALAELEPAPNDGDDRLVRWLRDGEKP